MSGLCFDFSLYAAPDNTFAGVHCLSSIQLMLNEENLGPTLFMLLQRLHESVVDIFRDNANHVCEPSSQAPILLLDAACTYKTILAGAERMNSKTEDSEAVHLALRLGLLFLSASYDDNIGAAGVGSVEPSPLSSPSEADTYLSINRCIIDGLERVAGLLSPGNPTETQLRGELARVVRSLACSAAHEQLQLDLTSPRHPHPTHGVDATASFSQRQRALIESRLQCARLLVERGLNCCSDAEYLLSSTPQDGSTLQRFLLQTVQEEFTTMRRLASGALAAFCDSSDSPATSLAAAEDISGATSSFHFYAPLALCCGGSAARHGRSSSTASASALSTGCITPRSRHAGDDGGW
ncbi:hypothetical protein DQ04_04701070, partial [Trypanosoma grayi]|uniref:hypothetical protein n=1 Tax=Trypanosoma grayi TaxID=71804 RepID=UPI0004F4A78E